MLSQECHGVVAYVYAGQILQLLTNQQRQSTRNTQTADMTADHYGTMKQCVQALFLTSLVTKNALECVFRS